MKRSQLIRRTPLRTKPLARSKKRLPPVSAKRRKLKLAVDELRREFRELFPVCWKCRTDVTTDVHELTRGVFRAKGYGDRRAWFATCRQCHEQLSDYGKVSLVAQLCLKHLNDGEYFSLDWINQTRGRASTAITTEEINDAN